MVSQFLSRTRLHTPTSNTGLFLETPKPTTKLDWLQGVITISSSQLDTLIGEISQTFADSFDGDRGYFFTGRKFDHHRVSGRGARVAWNLLKRNDNNTDFHFLDEKIYDVWFSIPAKVLSTCQDFFFLNRFIGLLSQMEFRPTRIDIAIDDYSKSIAPSQFIGAFNRQSNRGYRSMTHIQNYDPSDLGEVGFTLYLGSRGSDKMYRYYNKNVESKGEVNSYRLESEWKDGYAASVWKTLLQLGRCDELRFYQTLTSICMNGIEFYQLEKENDYSSKVYEQWWLDFKNYCESGELKVRCDRQKSTIVKTVEWIENQVQTSLAMLEKYYEHCNFDFAEWLNGQLEDGRHRLTSFHLNKIESQIAFDDFQNGFF